jgi:hypothetical protein
MNEETFNLSVRKFLKSFGLQGQHEIERAVANAVASGAVSGTKKFPGTITLAIPGLKLNVQINGEIDLG